MPAKPTSSAPGDADKLIAHQARLLKAPRIAEHYHRLAEQGRGAGWPSLRRRDPPPSNDSRRC